MSYLIYFWESQKLYSDLNSSYFWQLCSRILIFLSSFFFQEVLCSSRDCPGTSSCRPGCPQTPRDLPASVSHVLGLKAWAITSWIFLCALIKYSEVQLFHSWLMGLYFITGRNLYPVIPCQYSMCTKINTLLIDFYVFWHTHRLSLAQGQIDDRASFVIELIVFAWQSGSYSSKGYYPIPCGNESQP